MSDNTKPQQEDESPGPNDNFRLVRQKYNLKPTRVDNFKPKTLNNQNDNLGIPDDKEETQININLLKDKIEKILEMVSGDFAASIDKVLKLIEKLKEQLNNSECSKVLEKVGTEVEKLKLNKEQDEQLKDDIKYADDILGNINKILLDSKQDTNLKITEDKVNRLKKDVISEEEKYVETQNIALQENEKEYNEILDDVNKTVEELKTNYKLTQKENDTLIMHKEELLKNLNIKKMLKDTKTRITNILTQLNSISTDTYFGKVTKPNTKYFNKLKCLLRELTNYYTSYYIDNADKAFNYEIINKIKENITLILTFYNKNFKVTNANSMIYTDIDIDFNKIKTININHYNTIINNIVKFNKYLEDSITNVTKEINKNRQNINTMKENIKNNHINERNLQGKRDTNTLFQENKQTTAIKDFEIKRTKEKQSRQTPKTGGSNSKRNKTNKFKMRKSKKLKGKWLKKQPVTKRRKNRSKKH